MCFPIFFTVPVHLTHLPECSVSQNFKKLEILLSDTDDVEVEGSRRKTQPEILEGSGIRDCILKIKNSQFFRIEKLTSNILSNWTL